MKLFAPSARRRSRRNAALTCFGAWLLVAPLPTAAQDSTEAEAARCGAPEYREFDFWVGEWEVRNPPGDLVGRSSIRRILGGCVIHESWTGTDGSTGESFNIYDARRAVWHQTWVDNSGLLLELEGGLEGQAMVLRGETETPDGAGRLQRITWTPVGDGSVRQLWERSTDGGVTWATVFDGTYRTAGADGVQQPED